MLLKKRYHYFSICLSEETGKIRSAIMVGQSRCVTAPLIKRAYEHLSFPETAVVVNACWLGKMTQEEYQNGIVIRSRAEAAKAYIPWVCCLTLAASLAYQFL
jgi:hypothetical protein